MPTRAAMALLPLLFLLCACGVGSGPAKSAPSVTNASANPIAGNTSTIANAENASTNPTAGAAQIETAQAHTAQVFRLMNEERARAGAPALVRDDALDAAAALRAVELSRRFAHIRPGGGRWDGVLDEKKIHWTKNGENIGMGQQSAAEVMVEWMQSVGHRANILDGAFTRAGLGWSRGADGNTYWVQVFIRP